MDYPIIEGPGFFERTFLGGGPGLFGVFFALLFIFIIGMFIFVIGSSIRQWSQNNSSPRLTVPAKVVTKRTNTRGGSGDSSASTTYYVTFEVSSGDRMELQLNGQEYGMLADGDMGILSFQGTRYLSFERK
ncbi:DUF2500 domain-containing protein [Chungangia koreensis]|uniref:DUF2500 domain-containing protein n=1 Tax=Chungangia koreensis TaxID=752657 RepID=A0ABV8X8P2_9LACT